MDPEEIENLLTKIQNLGDVGETPVQLELNGREPGILFQALQKFLDEIQHPS